MPKGVRFPRRYELVFGCEGYHPKQIPHWCLLWQISWESQGRSLLFHEFGFIPALFWATLSRWLSLLGGGSRGSYFRCSSLEGVECCWKYFWSKSNLYSLLKRHTLSFRFTMKMTRDSAKHMPTPCIFPFQLYEKCVTEIRDSRNAYRVLAGGVTKIE
jgi:hypothetical protein